MLLYFFKIYRIVINGNLFLVDFWKVFHQFSIIADIFTTDESERPTNHRNLCTAFVDEWWGVVERDYTAQQLESREKLADFIMQSRWMDSRLLRLLSFSENPSSLDGEPLFMASKYALKKNNSYRLFINVFPPIRHLDSMPSSMNVTFDDVGNASIDINIDGEQRTVPLINYSSIDDQLHHLQ